MTFDLQQILAGKRAYRKTLATADIVVKLAILDQLHDRAMMLRDSRQLRAASQESRDQTQGLRKP